VNRKHWIIAGIIVTILFVVGIMSLLNKRSSEPTEVVSHVPVSELVYCNDDQIKPCIVSFGIDADGNMLVNLLLPDISFPRFYLKVVRGEEDVLYECRRVIAAPNNAYCIGSMLAPGEILRLMLLSTNDDSLLAQGELPIIGLAFPTLEIVIPTNTPTMTPLVPESTATNEFVLPTSTQPSYPNQSYPNQSYP